MEFRNVADDRPSAYLLTGYIFDFAVYLVVDDFCLITNVCI